MTPGEACKIRSLKEDRDESYKVFFHVPHFVVRRRRLRRRFAVLLRDSRTQLHHASSELACNLVYFGVLPICHKDGTLCSFGQGTTSGLPYTRKVSVGEAPRCCSG